MGQKVWVRIQYHDKLPSLKHIPIELLERMMAHANRKGLDVTFSILTK